MAKHGKISKTKTKTKKRKLLGRAGPNRPIPSRTTLISRGHQNKWAQFDGRHRHNLPSSIILRQKASRTNTLQCRLLHPRPFQLTGPRPGQRHAGNRDHGHGGHADRHAGRRAGCHLLGGVQEIPSGPSHSLRRRDAAVGPFGPRWPVCLQVADPASQFTRKLLILVERPGCRPNCLVF